MKIEQELRILQEVQQALATSAQQPDDIETTEEEMKKYEAEVDESVEVIVNSAAKLESIISDGLEYIFNVIYYHPQSVRKMLAERIASRLQEQQQ